MLRSAGVLYSGFILFLVSINFALQAQETLRTTTQLVEIDTIATDSHGKPVTDLKVEDFKLLEDGKERPLSHFSFETIQRVDPAAAQRMHDLAQKQKPGVYANFTAETAVVPPNGCTVLLIDWLNTPIELQGQAFQELKKFIETADLSKPLAIYALDRTLRQVQGFTTDRQALKNSVERNGAHNANLQPEKRATRQLDSERNDFRVNKTVAALLEIGKDVQGLQGHKSLLWLSGSFPAALIPTNLTGLNPDMEGTYGGYLYGDPRRYSDAIAKATEVLSAQNVAVYPVDAQGLQGSMTDASQQSFRYYVNPIYQTNFERQEAMRGVAYLTGGRVFYNRNDIGGELNEAYNDANNFYALAFKPAKNNPDGKMHRVRVECRRSGVHIRYRPNYFAAIKQDSAKIRRTELESLVGTLDRPAVGMPVMAEIDKKENDHLNLWLSGDGLSRPSPQEPILLVDVAIATFDTQGNLLQHNYANLRIKMSPDQLQQVQTGGLSQTLQFARTKESVRLRIAVRDLASGRVGTLELPLQ